MIVLITLCLLLLILIIVKGQYINNSQKGTLLKHFRRRLRGETQLHYQDYIIHEDRSIFR